MTENEKYIEIIKSLDCENITSITCDYKKTGCSDCDFMLAKNKAIQALEDIQQYRAIGTIEEFKAFKLGRLGNKGFITIGQTMEEYAQKIRANAIDEFAEKINTDVESFVAEVDGVRADLLTLDYFSEFVFEVAEKLKGGA